jgi:putative membrane protein insertion efficiency factor
VGDAAGHDAEGKVIRFILISAVRVYRLALSPAKTVLFGPLGRCRFTPSCSQYALEAIQLHGARRGSGLALRRLCRCHPWGDCGHDPVPSVDFQFKISNLKSKGVPAAGASAKSRPVERLIPARPGV